jgi:chemotaxis protein histidine kinase CheA
MGSAKNPWLQRTRAREGGTLGPMSDEVFSNLPRSRPVRRSAKRGARPGQDGDGAAALQAEPAKATAKPKAATRGKAKAKPAAGKPKVAASRSGAGDTANAAAATPKATAKASTAASSKAKATTKARAARPAAAKRAARTGPAKATSTPARGERGTVVANRGRATRTPARPPSAGTKRPPQEPSRTGADLVTTAVQAAGELAQVGLTLGGQIVKRAVERIHKP